MPKKKQLLLEDAPTSAPAETPSSVPEVSSPRSAGDPTQTEQGRLEAALEPFESDKDRRAFVVEQLLAAQYWGTDVTIRVPVSLVTGMLERLASYAAATAAEVPRE